ncbi:PAS domain S-box protein [Halogeometricum limi]|uniref:histidine kinase n=1 Tax=Halogeometricum limi TaxID=555875 RepID=A0A1I6I313_9EURY|nr:PAS domain-containing sensor histidine kinase [Halogeometricum limi]SFR61122.1 PAS domain S-box-containing protein [Halogeometricum limi]
MSDYREIFEKLPDGILVHETDTGEILDSNDLFCEMLGYPREELLELSFQEIHPNEPPYTLDRAAELVRRAAAEGPQQFEWVVETKAGGRLPVEVHLCETAIEDESRVLAVVRDITERKRREQELRLQNERLAKFASVVSHDLRNPLSVAHGRVELAREECDSDHLDVVARAHRRMEDLIEDLLVLAREGMAAIDIHSVALAERAEAAWSHVGHDEATLTVDSDGTLRADPMRLDQLLENLFRNCIEHGGDDVAVSVGELPDGSGFYVEDDGVGIPERDRDAVFEVGHTTSPTGTGIGLSIVSEVAAAHDWEVRLTESDAGGARFEIRGVDAAE